jgi:hypothetical protein
VELTGCFFVSERRKLQYSDLPQGLSALIESGGVDLFLPLDSRRRPLYEEERHGGFQRLTLIQG